MIRILVIGSLRSPPKGGSCGMVHEIYDSLFFLSILLVSPWGEVPRSGKGCTGQSTDKMLHRYPDRQSAAPWAKRCTANMICRSVSDAQNVVSRFPFRGRRL